VPYREGYRVVAWSCKIAIPAAKRSMDEEVNVTRKVLVIAGHFPPMKSGEADHAFHLSRRLHEYGLDVDVLTTRGNIDTNGHEIRVHPVMRDWSWKDLPIMMRVMKRCSPDAVLLMYIGWIYNMHPMVTYAPTLSKLLLPGAPFVTLVEFPQGADPRELALGSRIIRKAVERLAGRDNADYTYGTLLRDSESIIVLSDRHRMDLAKYDPGVNRKSTLIPPPPLLPIVPDENGAVRQEVRKVVGIQSDEVLIAYFGFIYEGKGVETLLRAFQTVSNSQKHVRLILIGGVPTCPSSPGMVSPSFLEMIYRLPTELGVEDKVIWTGEYASDSDAASRYLHAADICVLPFDEGVYLNNSSFAAAAAHGLPIITTQARFVEPPFLHNENVFLCPPKEPAVLAAAILTVLADPVLRERLGAGARHLAEEWFSWESTMHQTIKTLNGARDRNANVPCATES
jgi:glycosyltransferase involved in cell wall biosynthesis